MSLSSAVYQVLSLFRYACASSMTMSRYASLSTGRIFLSLLDSCLSLASCWYDTISVRAFSWASLLCQRLSLSCAGVMTSTCCPFSRMCSLMNCSPISVFPIPTPSAYSTPP